MKRKEWLIFGILFVVFLTMNYLTPISVADDGAFAFVKESVGLEFDVSRPIKNLSDILESQINHWHTANGRVVCESFVQLFIGILGKTAFNIINSFVFCIVVFMLLEIVSWKDRISGVCLISLIFLLFMPAFAETMLWFTGSFNYLWTAFFVLGFLIMLRHYEKDTLSRKHWLLMPVAFICGWTHEMMTLPVSMALGLYMLLHIRRIWGRAVLPLMLGFMMGTAMDVLAPATFVRAGADDVADAFSSITGKVKSFIVSVIHLKVFWLLMISIIGLSLAKNSVLKGSIKQYKWLLLIVFFSFFVILMAGYSKARVFFGTEFFSLLALLGLLNYSKLIKNNSIIPKLLFIPIFILVGFIIYYQKINYDHFRVCESQMKDSNTLMILTPTDKIPEFWSNYTMKHVDYGEDVYYLACDKNKTMVRYMSALYGKTGMFYFPQAIIDDMNTNPSHYDDFYTLPDVGLYVKRIKGDRIVGKASFELREPTSGEVPFYIIPFAKYISAYSSLTCIPDNQTIVSIDGCHYYVIPEPLNGMAQRVKTVVIQ